VRNRKTRGTLNKQNTPDATGITRRNMEADQNLGSVGTASEKVSGGVASANASIEKSFLNGAVKAKINVEVDIDAVAALELIKAKVEAALPAGKVIEDFAFNEIETALKAIV
jgi:hypothetical protein